MSRKYDSDGYAYEPITLLQLCYTLACHLEEGNTFIIHGKYVSVIEVEKTRNILKKQIKKWKKRHE